MIWLLIAAIAALAFYCLYLQAELSDARERLETARRSRRIWRTAALRFFDIG